MKTGWGRRFKGQSLSDEEDPYTYAGWYGMKAVISAEEEKMIKMGNTVRTEMWKISVGPVHY
jgi:hypothetical protein